MREYLQMVETVDERGKTKDISFYRVFKREDEGHFISHGLSYLKAREFFQGLSGDEPFGLEVVLGEDGK